jgi:hypothetical protein
VSDAVNLPPEALDKTRAIIKRGIAQWSALVEAAVPISDHRRARLRVQAAMAAIHDLVRLGHFASRPRIFEETVALARVILQL